LAGRWRPGAIVCDILGAWENFVFLLRSGKETAVLRITEETRRKEHEIIGELALVEHLKLIGFPVPAVLLFQDGSKLSPLDSDNNRFFACLFTEVAGQQVSARTILDEPNGVESWGEMIGLLHNAMVTFRSEVAIRGTWAENELITHTPLGVGLPPHYVPFFQSVVSDLRQRTVSVDDFGLVHADLHGRNVLATTFSRTVIDFDDMCYHWHAYDLAVAWNWLCHADGDTERMREGLLAGYSRSRNASLETHRLLPRLAFLRTCLDFMFLRQRARSGVRSPLISVRFEMLARCLRLQLASI
jgi:Ser/Thr protein kinase RdoA (MazF antagonist)